MVALTVTILNPGFKFPRPHFLFSKARKIILTALLFLLIAGCTRPGDAPHAQLGERAPYGADDILKAVSDG